jgi:hypothetical protein
MIAGLAVLVLSALLVEPGFAGATGRTRVQAAVTAAGAFTKTETITRDHLLNGVDTLVDSRSFSVSVDQTTGLRERQEIAVSWTGAHPTGGIAADPNSSQGPEQEYPVVLMECRGVDSTTAPANQQLSPTTCWTHTPNERVGLGNGQLYPAFRSDRYASPADRAKIVGAPSPLPAACGLDPIQHWVPFVAEDGTVYPQGFDGCDGIAPEEVVFDNQALQPDSTTYAATGLDGSGSTNFTVASAESNASLGCSDTVACSLVIIPIMGISCDPAGVGMNPSDRPSSQVEIDSATSLCTGTGNFVAGTQLPGDNLEDLAVSGFYWWSASNWRNRISVPLQFAPSPNVCALANAAKPLYFFGSELMAQATQQWAPAFCLNPKLFKWQHVQSSEPEAKNLLQSGAIEAALQAEPPQPAFTSPIVQAPVGLSGFAIAFAVDDKHGVPLETLNLTPRLLAKLMTESYPTVPDIRNSDPPLEHNPLDLEWDPEFQALNPGVQVDGLDFGMATLYSISSSSDAIYALTSYIEADPAARAWLDGTPDPWGMVVNPAYKGIKLPISQWPLLDTYVGAPTYSDPNSCFFQNPVPYLGQVASPADNLATVTLNMQFDIDNSQISCQNPGTVYKKLVAVGRQTPGQRFLLGVVPLADAARYGLQTASLQTQVSPTAAAKFTDGSGRTFVAPTNSSLAAAAALLQPDQAEGTWVLPYSDLQTTAKAAAAYPGTLLMSADVPTAGLPAADAARYATFLDWVVTTGQTPGTANGNLAPGFLPLTAANGLGSEARYTVAAASAVATQDGKVPPLIPSPQPSQTTTTGPQTTTTVPGTITVRSGHTQGSGGTSLSSGLTGGIATVVGATPNATAGVPASSAKLRPGAPAATARIEQASARGTTPGAGSGLGGLALPIAAILFVAGAGSVAALRWPSRLRATRRPLSIFKWRARARAKS